MENRPETKILVCHDLKRKKIEKLKKKIDK